jgi:eukaryotic-like serine/threonine-protein kinase
MGVVYEARHLGTGRKVAIKVIPSDAAREKSDVVARFQREARAAGTIESRHVARVIDTGRDATTGDSYLAMDLLRGEDLQSLIGRLGPLPPDLALRIASQACLGLEKAHEAGVVHRDIKPSNLFLAKQDRGEIIVTLLDFGIAKMGVDQLATVGEAALTRTGSLVGSPLYMSPEQAKGSKTIDHRTDLWSLGVVLYEALTGGAPNSTTESLGSLIMAICSAPPPPVQDRAPWVTADVAAVVHRALVLDPTGRFTTAAEMGSAIRAFLPAGHALDESSMTPLGSDRRVLVSPKLVVRPSLPDVASGNLPEVNAFAPTVSGTSTDVTMPRPGWRKGSVAVAVAIASAAAIGVAAMALHRPSSPTASMPPSASTSAVGLPPVPPMATAPAPSAAPAVVVPVSTSATPTAMAGGARAKPVTGFAPEARASSRAAPAPSPAPKPTPTAGEVDREFR